jgi:hypothetical protein
MSEQEPNIEIKKGELGVFFGTGPEKGRIVIGFHEPIKWLALDPKNAVEVAKEFIDKATHLGTKVHLMLPKRELSPMKYQALVTRVGLVMKNQLERKVDPKLVARQIVDIVLSGADRL